MQCSSCSAEVPPGSDNLFCEECGASLQPAVAAGTCACGAPLTEVDPEGYCLSCGRRHRISLPEDHMEEALFPWLAAVSDRGERHERNEDRFGLLQLGAYAALVVCDGVSSSRSPETASTAVVRGVLQSLSEGLKAGESPEAGQFDPARMLREAIARGASLLTAEGNLETRRLSASRKLRAPDNNPPSTTVVAALAGEGVCTVAWLGDSRAYWIAGGEAAQLTRDHSWLNSAVEAGEMTREEAARSPRAHAITRWVGADSADCEPEVVTMPLEGDGALLLCTDGLWNYLPTPAEMGEAFREASRDAGSSIVISQRLVDLANSRGGQDNITVALLHVGEGKMQANPAEMKEMTEQHGESI